MKETKPTDSELIGILKAYKLEFMEISKRTYSLRCNVNNVIKALEKRRAKNV